MAKVIQISSDGTTWYKLPGSQGSFNSTAEEADDTILGQTFKSSEIGLIEWNVESDGIFKGFAGYHSDIKVQGTSTGVTGGACTVESGKIYAINDATKHIINRNATITVKDGVTDVTDEVEWIDYLFGRFKFLASYTVVGSITIDYEYYPTVTIGKGNAYTLTMSTDAVDDSNYASAQANGGFKTFQAGLRTVALEIQGTFSSTENAKEDLRDRNELICEIDVVGDGSTICRGYFKVIETSQSGSVGALEEETISLALSVPADALLLNVFAWKFTSTTLSTAIQKVITSWMNELNTYEVRYLPTGAIGATPNDGIEGAFVVTDLSLQGSLNGMNVFNVSLQGTGAYTEV